MSTICNMGAELGATERLEIAAEAAKYRDSLLSPDAVCKYDQVGWTFILSDDDGKATPK